MQAMGAVGLFPQYGYDRLLTSARISAYVAGTTEMQNERIGAARRGAKCAVRLGRREMTLDVKGVVDRGVRGEKFLRRTRTLEPLHLALPPPRWLMRILRSIVLPSPAFMPAFDPKNMDGGAV